MLQTWGGFSLRVPPRGEGEIFHRAMLVSNVCDHALWARAPAFLPGCPRDYPTPAGYAMESLRRALRAGDQCGRGCPSRTRPLPRCMGRSSNALAARCHALLRADGPKPRRASPLCCGSGASTTSFHPAPVPQRTRKWTRRCQLHAKIAPTGIILDYGDGSTCHYPRSLTSLGLCTGQSHGMHPRHVP
jgi:hypothetical protein